jgi:hypothetical protein
VNEIVDALPPVESDCYRVVAPRWLSALLQFFSALFGVGTLWIAVREWAGMPLWVNVLVCLLVPTFFLMAFHPRGWAAFSSKPSLQADGRGIYFPSQTPQVLGRPETSRWLLVPWGHVSNIRVAKVMTTDGKTLCAAFDVIATPDEVKEFFNDRLIDNAACREGSVPVAFYQDALPSPQEVVARLIARAV